MSRVHILSPGSSQPGINSLWKVESIFLAGKGMVTEPVLLGKTQKAFGR